MAVQNIIQKKILFKDHSSEYLTVFCLLMLLSLLPFSSKIQFVIDEGTILLFYLLSILSVCAWILIIKAHRHMEISTVEPLRNLSPLIVLVLAYFTLGEEITLLNGVGIFFLMLGGYVLESAVEHANLLRPFSFFRGKYGQYIFFSLLLGGFCTILTRVLVLQTNAWTTLFFLFFFASINMLLIQFFKYDGMKDILYVLKTNGILVIIVVAATLLSDILFLTALALPTISTTLVIAIRRLSTLFTTIVGGEIFHEKRLLIKSTACLIMIIGVYFIVI